MGKLRYLLYPLDGVPTGSDCLYTNNCKHNIK